MTGRDGPRRTDLDPLEAGRIALGRRLRDRRLEQELRLIDLAELTGFSYVYLSECERGLKLPTLALLVPWCDALGLLTSQALEGIYPFGSRNPPGRPSTNGR